ncbi:hypothetical protein FQZ97_1199390 [compost metagenome]
MQHDLAAVRPVAVYEQIEALPGAERHAAGIDGDADRDLRQRRLDVRGHIVRPFLRVHHPAH